MACPDCGSSLGEFRIATSIETHGLDCGPFERFEQEFILCRHCGGRFDVSDWDDTPELSGPPDAGLAGTISSGGALGTLTATIGASFQLHKNQAGAHTTRISVRKL